MSEVIASTIGYGIQGIRIVALGHNGQPVALDPKNITIDLAHGVIAAISAEKIIENGVKRIVYIFEGNNVNAQAIEIVFENLRLVDIHPPNKSA